MSEEFKTQTREAYRESWPEPQPLPRPDMLNRLMSLGALIIATAALWHSMGGWTGLRGAGEAVTSAAKSVDDGINAVASNLSGGDSEQTKPVDMADDSTDPADAIDPVGIPASTPSTPDETAVAEQSPPTEIDDMSDDVNDLFQEPADSTLAASDETEPADTDDSESMIDLLDRDPQLRIVHTALRPTSELATAVVRIENTGVVDAVITDAIFRPTEVEEVPFGIAKARVGITSTDRLVLRFTGEDNQASQAGRHADYARKLSQPFAVPAGETVEVRVAIEGREYAGYGFTGDLRLRFGENENLDVSGMTVAFVE